MTELLEALGIQSGMAIAVAGAGGKTTLCWRLVQALASHGHRAIFTTTTRIWQPAAGTFDRLHIGPPAHFSAHAHSAEWTTACLAAAVDGERNPAPVAGASMPTVQTKLIGYAPELICALRASFGAHRITLLIEADGARGLRIKAPGEGEPVIPACVEAVCVLANLDAIGRPLDDRVAHRVDRVARLTHTMPGAIITAPALIALLTHADGGLKGIPPDANKIAVLTQQHAAALHPDAPTVMAALAQGGFDRVATIAPRAPRPVLLAINASTHPRARNP